MTLSSFGLATSDLSGLYGPVWIDDARLCGHFAKSGDETVTLYADGTAVEIPIF